MVKTVLFVLYASILTSQIQLKGIVIDSTNSPIPSVKINLINYKDTSQIDDRSVSNAKGLFLIKCQKGGKYILSFSHLSYLKQKIILNIAKDTFINIVLNPSPIQLKEVSIKAENTYFSENKIIHNITENDIKQSINSLYMLEIFPQIEINPLTQSITTKDKKKIKVLINGISADQYQILAIKKDEILKIEYYDIAPSRFKGYNSAINVVTKNEFIGINFSVFGSKSINKGYGYGSASLKYSRNKSLFGLYYNNNIGRYNSIVANETMSYNFNDIDFEKVKKGIKSPNDFNHHNFTLNYIYHNKKNLDIVLKLIPRFYYSYNENSQNILSTINNNLIDNSFQKTKEERDKFTNTLNFYLYKHLKNRQGLIFDLSYNYFDYIYSRLITEIKDKPDTIFSDNYTVKSIKNSFISELFYTKSFKTFRFNTDINHQYAIIKQNSKSTISFPTAHYFRAYVELEGKYKKFNYKSNFGLSLYYFCNNELKLNYNKKSIQYLANVDYNISSNNKVSIIYKINSSNPSLAQLNNSQYQLDEFVFRRGNPLLNSYYIHLFRINHYYYLKRLSIYSMIKYVFAPDKITNCYYNDSKGIIKSFTNIDREKYKAFTLNINYYPFVDKWLKLGIYFKADNSKISLKDNSYSRSGYYFQPLIQIYYKKFLLQYLYYSKQDFLGDYLTYTIPQHSYIVIGYQFQNFAISIDGYYPFSESWKSIYKTIPQSIVNSKKEYYSFDNGKMFSLRFNYIFSKGKIIKPGKKKLENEDNDTGVLEEKEK